MRAIAEEVGIIEPLDLFKEFTDAKHSRTLSADRSRDLIKYKSDGRDALKQEIYHARLTWEENEREAADDTVGLSVNRTISFDDEITWGVTFAQDYGMTIIIDQGAEKQSDEQLADLVIGCWDADWDE